MRAKYVYNTLGLRKSVYIIDDTRPSARASPTTSRRSSKSSGGTVVRRRRPSTRPTSTRSSPPPRPRTRTASTSAASTTSGGGLLAQAAAASGPRTSRSSARTASSTGPARSRARSSSSPATRPPTNSYGDRRRDRRLPGQGRVRRRLHEHFKADYGLDAGRLQRAGPTPARRSSSTSLEAFLKTNPAPTRRPSARASAPARPIRPARSTRSLGHRVVRRERRHDPAVHLVLRGRSDRRDGAGDWVFKEQLNFAQ